MPNFIFKPTRREREEQLRTSSMRSSQPGVRGVLRSTEEAFDVQRDLERQEGKQHIFAVSGDAPESKAVKEQDLVKQGINPETMETLHSESTKHD